MSLRQLALDVVNHYNKLGRIEPRLIETQGELVKYPEIAVGSDFID